MTTGVSSAKRLDIWPTIAHTYTAMITIIMGMQQWTVQTRYHHQAHHPATELTTGTGIGDPPLDNPVIPDINATTTGTGPGSVAPTPTLAITAIKAVADMSTAGTTQGPPIDIPIATLHAIEAPAHIAIIETPYTQDLLTTTLLGTTADPGITPNSTTTNLPEDHLPHGTRTRGRNLNRFPLTTLSPIITVWRKVKATQGMI